MLPERPRKCLVALAGAVLAAACASCTSSGNGAADDTVHVVASTDVWGSVIAAVVGRQAGTRVQVTSIITDPAADPHSYEANTRNQLAVQRADVIVRNGGGYDDFVDTLRKSANPHVPMLDAVTLSGRRAPAGGELNEHVFYDFPTVVRVAQRIAAVLSSADPRDAPTFRSNARAFAISVGRLEARERATRVAHAGAGVAITEPVPLYLLQACGLVDRTPAKFSEAIENGTDVSPAVLARTLRLFTDHRVRALVYNSQTAGPETERVLAAAKAAGVAMVPVTETLPAHRSFLSWMTANVDAVQAALR